MHVHFFFVTNYPRGVFTDEMLTCCEQVTREVCADFESEICRVQRRADHVHLLVNLPPKVAVPKPVNSLKGVSARTLRFEFTGRVNRFSIKGHLWSPSYFAAPCGGHTCRSSSSTSSSSSVRCAGRVAHEIDSLTRP
jgi:putative transposase